MLKKLVIVSLGVLGLGLVTVKSGMSSYVSTAYRRTSESVKDSVPMEFQIDRARNMVKDLEPEIRRSMHVIAKEEVEVGEIEKRIAEAETKAGKDKEEILQLQSDLDTGHRTFRYAGHSYTSAEVKSDLARRFNRFKTADATLESLRQMRDARSRNLEAARQKLTAMMSAQRQLQVEVENLEAKLKLVQVAEASSDFQFDDSALARCKELMADIRTRLDVDAKLANADTNFTDEIPLEETESEDVTQQVAEYFGLDVDADQDGQHDAEVATASFAH
jgi:chromosome segregation ATPase